MIESQRESSQILGDFKGILKGDPKIAQENL